MRVTLRKRGRGHGITHFIMISLTLLPPLSHLLFRFFSKFQTYTGLAIQIRIEKCRPFDIKTTKSPFLFNRNDGMKSLPRSIFRYSCRCVYRERPTPQLFVCLLSHHNFLLTLEKRNCGGWHGVVCSAHT